MKTKKNNGRRNRKTIKKNRNNKNVNRTRIIGLNTFETNIAPYQPQKAKQKLLTQLLSNFNPSNVKPQNDFYTYINYTWLQNVSLLEQQKYIVQVDNFRLAQHKVYEQLQRIMLAYMKDNLNSSFAKNMSQFYHSILQMNPKSSSRQLAKDAEKLIQDFIKNDNPWALLAHINADEMTAFMAPFVWNVDTNAYNSKVNCSYLVSHSFVLLDLDVYEENDINKAYKQRYRHAFYKMCNALFTTLLGPHHGYNVRDVYRVETEIYEALGCYKLKESKFDLSQVSGQDALEIYGFDWAEFTKHLGYKTAPAHFIVSSLNYLKCGTQLLKKNWNSAHWKTYWVYILLSRLARITKDWETINYQFFGEFERGQEQINRSDAVSASLYMSLPYNKFLTEQYVEQYTNPQIIEYAKTMCQDLKLVFRNMLVHNTWLQPATKKYAILKLDHFQFVFGKYDALREDPNLDYGTNLYDNLQKILRWRLHKFIEMDGHAPINIPLMDWSSYPAKMDGDQAYIVNASYTPAKNSIYINAGYLQPPFVDLDERGIEYNLAHLGFTIGHEMSHGFDDMGSQYGYDGNLHDWWLPEDKRIYKRMQHDVIKQYEEFARRDGIDFDASIGIGEDLADIGGLAICDHYLRDFQDKNADLLPIKRLGFEAFYVYFAFQQRQFVHKKALQAQLKTNPHPLDKYRCNVPLSRSTLFRGLYNVKRGDGMWWHNTNMIW